MDLNKPNGKIRSKEEFYLEGGAPAAEHGDSVPTVQPSTDSEEEREQHDAFLLDLGIVERSLYRSNQLTYRNSRIAGAGNTALLLEALRRKIGHGDSANMMPPTTRTHGRHGAVRVQQLLGRGHIEHGEDESPRAEQDFVDSNPQEGRVDEPSQSLDYRLTLHDALRRALDIVSENK
jgi:hypothetical protein